MQEDNDNEEIDLRPNKYRKLEVPENSYEEEELEQSLSRKGYTFEQSNQLLYDESSLITSDDEKKTSSIFKGFSATNKPMRAFDTLRDNCWNEAFQLLLEWETPTPQEQLSKFVAIGNLMEAFISKGKEVARCIIDEKYLPRHQKTYLPSDVGGIAGTQYAMKSASNELRALKELLEVSLGDMRFPLMAVYDYKGERIITCSALPINSDTLLYGSSDGGISFHRDEQSEEKLKETCMKLNLACHEFRQKDGIEFKIWSPGDCEVHKGRDNRMYVVDVARFFPPEVPTGLKTHMYYQLRPEIVKRSGIPLSSDAFSPWGKTINREKYEKDIITICSKLLTEIIPETAKNIKSSMNRIEIITLLHSKGINMRYLGVVRSCTLDLQVQKFLLVEMISRVLKTQLRHIMRTCQDIEEKVKQFFCEKFDSPSSFWKGEIQREIALKFEYHRQWAIVHNRLALKDSERNGDLLTFLDTESLHQIKELLKQVTCISIEKDTVHFNVREKHTQLVFFGEGIVRLNLSLDNSQTKLDEDRTEQLLQHALNSRPDSFYACYNISLLYLKKAQLHNKDENIEKALHYARLAQEFKLKYHPSKPVEELLSILASRNIGEAPKPLDFQPTNNREIMVASHLFPYSLLDTHQKKATKDMILKRLKEYLIKNSELYDQLLITDTEMKIFSSGATKNAGDSEYSIQFGEENKTIFNLPQKISEERPFEGIKIALNPIGIGGPLGKWDCSYIYVKGSNQPVDLGLCSLLVCSRLEEILRAKGATVYLTRKSIGEFATDEDINRWLQNAEDAMEIYRRTFKFLSRYLFMMEDNKKLLDKPSLQDPYQWLQSIIFAAGFRQKELNQIVHKINEFNPDFTFHLMFAAKGKDSSGEFLLEDGAFTRFYVPGSYMALELEVQRWRFEFTRCLMTDSVEKSIELSKYVLEQFREKLGIPPDSTHPDQHAVIKLDEGIFSRNLVLSTRVRSPICYLELYAVTPENVSLFSSLDGVDLKLPKILLDIVDACVCSIEKFVDANRKKT